MQNNTFSNLMMFSRVLMSRPFAVTNINGSKKFSNIKGTVKFFNTLNGVLVVSEINNLPSSEHICDSGVFGFHIHSGSECSGNEADEFSNAGTHYNPDGCTHPHHAGDMPPLFSNNGYAFSVFLSNRFTPNEIIGKTVIVHLMPDDFISQPSGNSGEKIACGKIVKL